MAEKIAAPRNPRASRARKGMNVPKAAARKAAPAKAALTVKRAAVKAVTDSKAAKPKKDKKDKKSGGKNKVVRDSFTMPQADYDLIAQRRWAGGQAGGDARAL